MESDDAAIPMQISRKVPYSHCFPAYFFPDLPGTIELTDIEGSFEVKYRGIEGNLIDLNEDSISETNQPLVIQVRGESVDPNLLRRISLNSTTLRIKTVSKVAFYTLKPYLLSQYITEISVEQNENMTLGNFISAMPALETARFHEYRGRFAVRRIRRTSLKELKVDDADAKHTADEVWHLFQIATDIVVDITINFGDIARYKSRISNIFKDLRGSRRYSARKVFVVRLFSGVSFLTLKRAPRIAIGRQYRHVSPTPGPAIAGHLTISRFGARCSICRFRHPLDEFSVEFKTQIAIYAAQLPPLNPLQEDDDDVEKEEVEEPDQSMQSEGEPSDLSD